MKALTKYNRVAGYLEQIYRLLNERFFENTLSTPVITIQSTPNAYGHVSVNDVWETSGERKKELNIGAGTLSRPIEEVAATMVHEMVHLYCIANGIKDTSRNGTYHNKKFKTEAEKRGLSIKHHSTYGYTITNPADELLQFIIDNDLVDIRINRIEFYGIPTIGKGADGGSNDSGGKTEKPPKKSSTRKYQCPCCGNSVRATKDINIICGDCMEPMIKN